MKYPAELYTPSPRPYKGLGEELKYPFHDRTITVTACGRICFNGCKINLSGVFAGQNVGIKQIAEKVWLVSLLSCPRVDVSLISMGALMPFAST